MSFILAFLRSGRELTWTSIFCTIVGSIFLLLLAAFIYCKPYNEYRSRISNLRGPQRDHWLYGSMSKIIKAPPMAAHAEWAKEFGHTFRYPVLFNIQRFYTEDLTALAFILANSDTFQKPMETRKGLTDLLGNGVLVAEGDVHKRQRKLLNSSFSPSAVRGMTPIFWEKAYELKDKLTSLVEEEAVGASPTPQAAEDKVKGGHKVDVMNYLGKATLDVIGLAGFNYDFKALSEPNNELADAYRRMFTAGMDITIMAILQNILPITKLIPTERARVTKEASATTVRVGRRLVEEKKKAVLAAHSGSLEKGSDIGKDLLSILVKANMASDVPADQKLTDDEMLAQITTFMLAGNETSSTCLTWTLYRLAQNPAIQSKLREELAAVGEETLSMDALNALPYLDAVIRESLRLDPPVPSTVRQASRDVVIPLGEPIVDKYGKSQSSVTLGKGTTLFVPIMNINRSEAIWGPNAKEFNPARFLGTQDSETQNKVPGVWGNLLTFLGGNRNCIGYRFALVEIKAILFVLVRAFEFDILRSKPEIEQKSSIVMRPRVKGEESAGLQMPLLVKPLSA